MAPSTTCSKCGGPRDTPGQRYCKDCHASYMRDWRERNPPSDEQRKRANRRRLARYYAQHPRRRPSVNRETAIEE